MSRHRYVSYWNYDNFQELTTACRLGSTYVGICLILKIEWTAIESIVNMDYCKKHNFHKSLCKLNHTMGYQFHKSGLNATAVLTADLRHVIRQMYLLPWFCRCQHYCYI